MTHAQWRITVANEVWDLEMIHGMQSPWTSWGPSRRDSKTCFDLGSQCVGKVHCWSSTRRLVAREVPKIKTEMALHCDR